VEISRGPWWRAAAARGGNSLRIRLALVGVAGFFAVVVAAHTMAARATAPAPGIELAAPVSLGNPGEGVRTIDGHVVDHVGAEPDGRGPDSPGDPTVGADGGGPAPDPTSPAGTPNVGQSDAAAASSPNPSTGVATTSVPAGGRSSPTGGGGTGAPTGGSPITTVAPHVDVTVGPVDVGGGTLPPVTVPVISTPILPPVSVPPITLPITIPPIHLPPIHIGL
jgi:hypothetical protein